MANSKSNGDRYAYATIDTAPGADGYWSDAVSMTNKNTKAIFFSQRGGGSATVTIQFKCPTDTDWTDLSTTETIEDGVRFRVDDFGAGVKWRAGVKEDAYSSGDVTVGFDW
jgi:hypothetical protein